MDKNIAVVYISHKLDEVMYLSDRITVIRDGENIVTMDKKDTNQDELITNMIGRELSNLYRKGAGGDRRRGPSGKGPDPHRRVSEYLL